MKRFSVKAMAKAIKVETGRTKIASSICFCSNYEAKTSAPGPSRRNLSPSPICINNWPEKFERGKAERQTINATRKKTIK